MDREDYEKAHDKLIELYVYGDTMSPSTFQKRSDALRDKFDEFQQEKASENRSVDAVGPEAGA